MIIDYQSNPGHAALYDMVDAATGRSMYDQPIFYADDEAGIYRVYLRDARGCFYFDPFHPDRVAWEERRGTFRLVLKAEATVAPEASPRVESWRDKPSFL
jgi:hypothetical protein